MIVIGGGVAIVADRLANIEHTYISNPDPWPQGIGVFDLTDMRWKDSYDATTDPYATPQMVKDYYAHNPRYPASLLENNVQRNWFTGESKCLYS